MRISDWSSDVCSSDLDEAGPEVLVLAVKPQLLGDVVAQFRRKSDCAPGLLLSVLAGVESGVLKQAFNAGATVRAMPNLPAQIGKGVTVLRSEEHTSELQSLMRNSYAVFCLKKKK